MTAAILTSQAAISTALANIMAGAGIETVPFSIYDGHKLSWMSTGAKPIIPEPLLKIKEVPARIGRLWGLEESVKDGLVEGAVQPSMAELEGIDFFRKWQWLQQRVNAVPSGDQFDFKLDFFQAAVWRQKAAGVMEKGMARYDYERYAEGLERDGDYTSAFMIWELAMACSDPVSPDSCGTSQRRSAAIALMNSIPDDFTELDPVSLRLARGLLYSLGVDRRVYNSILRKASEYYEAIGRLFEAGAYRVRIVYSILEHEGLEQSSWETVSRMIDSAVTLFEKSENKAIDTVELLQLGVDALDLAEVA